MTTNELTFESLHSQETIVLETANHVYRFLIIDASNRIGTLSGGSFGNHSKLASFLTSVSASENYHAEETGKVKVGLRAVFVYQSDKGHCHFVTSPITRLTHSKRATKN
jgi:hypothetical protein